MKKVLIIALLALGAAPVFAQTEKGNWLVGGDLSLSSAKNIGAGGSYLQGFVAPGLGYFIANNLAVGANVSYYFQSNFDVSYQALSFSPTARYYFRNSLKKSKAGIDEMVKLRPFVQASAGLQYNRSSDNLNASQHSTAGIVTGGVGLAYFIAPNVSIDATLSVQGNKDFRPVHDFHLNRPQLSVGFQIFLRKKGK